MVFYPVAPRATTFLVHIGGTEPRHRNLSWTDQFSGDSQLPTTTVDPNAEGMATFDGLLWVDFEGFRQALHACKQELSNGLTGGHRSLISDLASFAVFLLQIRCGSLGPKR
ncbi:hypothetical protein AAFG13_37620 [Bradyrhizobium sp. B124]|uniref:hypothetical protein n=1 Tax=Bradyrhizobium sp. B124 TaxID=3140245 RepID=UPI003182B9E1